MFLIGAYECFRIKARLSKEKPDEVDEFQKNIQPFIKDVMGSFKDWDLYIGVYETGGVALGASFIMK